MNHFLIRLENFDVHLKLEDCKLKRKWVDSIEYMRTVFSKPKDDKKVHYEKKMDNEINLEILAENEIRNWLKIKVIRCSVRNTFKMVI